MKGSAMKKLCYLIAVFVVVGISLGAMYITQNCA